MLWYGFAIPDCVRYPLSPLQGPSGERDDESEDWMLEAFTAVHEHARYAARARGPPAGTSQDPSTVRGGGALSHRRGALGSRKSGFWGEGGPTAPRGS